MTKWKNDKKDGGGFKNSDEVEAWKQQRQKNDMDSSGEHDYKITFEKSF